MKPAIVFDIDGTLINTPDEITKLLKNILISFGIDAHDTDIRANIGRPLNQIFFNLLGTKHNSQIEYCIQKYQELFRKNILPQANNLLFPGVTDVLYSLKQSGLSLAVATNKIYKSAETILKAANILDFFDIVVGADQVKQSKPYTDMGKLIIEKLNVLANNTFMVGDTISDIQMANSVGMYSIAVTYGIDTVEQLKSVNPNVLIDSFYDVPKYIELLYKLKS